MFDSKSFVLVTHFLLPGASHALRDFLISKKYNIFMISLPFHNQRNVIIEDYHNGKLVSKNSYKRTNKIVLVDYIVDFISVLKTIFTIKVRYETYVGVDNLNCLAGLILRKLGKVKKVIYYSIDFVPVRFDNSILNTLYHVIEKFCVKNSDEVWNVSPRIAEGRETFLKIPQKKYKQIVVPIGVNIEKSNPKIKRKTNQIIFAGHLLEKQGVQLVIEALPLVIKKIPDLKFVVVGGGIYLSTLKNIAKRLNLTNSVVFLGWIKDAEKVKRLMLESSLAVATYKPDKEKKYNFTYYADPTKIKEYLNSGLPVIMTDVPFNAYDIQKNKAGVVVEYDNKKIAEALLLFFQSSKKTNFYSKNAKEYISSFDWNNIFQKVVK